MVRAHAKQYRLMLSMLACTANMLALLIFTHELTQGRRYLNDKYSADTASKEMCNKLLGLIKEGPGQTRPPGQDTGRCLA